MYPLFETPILGLKWNIVAFEKYTHTHTHTHTHTCLYYKGRTVLYLLLLLKLFSHHRKSSVTVTQTHNVHSKFCDRHNKDRNVNKIVHFKFSDFVLFEACMDPQSLSCVRLFCDPVDYSLPGFSVLGIFQERILEWVAISSSRGSSWPRDQTQVSSIGRRILYQWATCSLI